MKLSEPTWLTSPNTVAFWTTAPLPYLLTNEKVIEFEKFSFGALENLKTVC